MNKFQYHHYYPGNCANMIVALDYMGLEDIARRALLFVYPVAVGKRGSNNWPETSPDGLKLIEDGQYLFNDTRGLHYWQTPNNSQNALVRGKAADQRAAVEDLYALLLHTMPIRLLPNPAVASITLLSS